MLLQKDGPKREEFPDDRPIGDDLVDGLLVAADRAFALGNREIGIILIDEIFRVIDGLK